MSGPEFELAQARITALLALAAKYQSERDHARAALERVKDVVRAERQDDSDDPKRRAYQQGRRDMTRVFRAAIEGTP